MKILRTYLSILVAILLFLPVTVSHAAAAEPLDEVRNLVEQYYYKDVPQSVLNSTTIQDLTGQLDPYSVYMSKEEFESFINSIEGKLVGIGVTIEEHAKGIKITSILKGGAAEKSGLKTGDIILSVDGKKLAGKSVQNAITLITGEEGTKVKLEYYRPSTKSTITKTLTRQVIELANVETSKLAGNIGYIRLNSYSQNAGKEVQDAIKSMPGMKGWIFDLRDNTGGYVSAAQDVLGLFPKVKDAFTLTYKGNMSETYSPIKQKVQWNAPVALLINSMSASASEMTAVSVKDQRAGKLYGQNSFGKGVMQNLFTLSQDQGLLKLTVAEFFGPNGTAVQGKGVKPNVVTPIGKEVEYSHRDLILSGLKNYKKMPAQKVYGNKVFTIKTSSSMNWTTLKYSNVSLIELGNQKQSIKIQKTNNQLKITPTKRLKSGAKYLLIVEPKSKTSKKLVTEVSVK